MPKFFSGKREVYLEVAERYAHFIKIGVLKDGDRLPSVRVAAGELGINPNTVQKAYAHLEEQGVIYSLPKKGVFVADTIRTDQPESPDLRAVRDILCGLKAQGLKKDEIMKMIEEVFMND